MKTNSAKVIDLRVYKLAKLLKVSYDILYMDLLYHRLSNEQPEEYSYDYKNYQV
jgi:hypothetical protein